jgi:hypothetical protein
MLQKIVTQRNIDILWHFTRIANLDSILNNGITPRSILENAGSSFEFNDELRLNGQKEASCISIQFPNYKMFYGLRSNNPGIDWLVLGLAPSILWEKDCAFCSENAASSRVTKIELDTRKGHVAFESLFEDNGNRSVDIPVSYPTNPQAEVLVFDEIEPKYIIKVVTCKPTILTKLSRKYPHFIFECSHKPYDARLDWRKW